MKLYSIPGLVLNLTDCQLLHTHRSIPQNPLWVDECHRNPFKANENEVTPHKSIFIGFVTKSHLKNTKSWASQHRGLHSKEWGNRSGFRPKAGKKTHQVCKQRVHPDWKQAEQLDAAASQHDVRASFCTEYQIFHIFVKNRTRLNCQAYFYTNIFTQPRVFVFLRLSFFVYQRNFLQWLCSFFNVSF